MQPSPVVLQNASTYKDEPTCDLYRANFFGPFRVIRENQPLGEPGWRRNKSKALLKWFLLNPGRMFSADQLVKLFWPDITRSAGLRNLHVTINYLRHVLEPDLSARQESTFVCRNKNNFYRFELNECWWSDIADIQYHYTAAKEAVQRKDKVEVVNHYRVIARYCSMGFLPEDAYEDIFAPYRRQYDYLYTQVLNSLICLCFQLKMLDDAFTYAQQALQQDPYCESAINIIIRLCLQQGNISEAMRKLDDFRRLLKEEGIEPGEEFLSLRKHIIRLRR